jgi:FkbM family methyltransferase
MSIIRTLGFIANHPLNRNNKSAALLRFFKWQVGSRLVPGPVVVEWVGNAKMLVRRHDHGFTQNIYCGLHDVAEMAYVLHVLSDEDVFVDIGANVGAYTVLACAVKQARGFCFEPVPSTFARLTENLVLNKLEGKVTSFNFGLADVEGELLFTAGEDSANHVLQPGDKIENSIEVPVRTLDSMLAGESPAVIKMDVEGFETAVLKGASNVLRNPSLHSVLMELNGLGMRYGFDEGWILNYLQGFGFSAFEYDPFVRQLSPVAGKKSDGTNTIFIRGTERIANVLKNVPKVQVGQHWI